MLSVLAMALLAFALVTGWERGLKDEGAVAHGFQLLIVAQAPFVLGFLATADWKRAPRVAASLAVQAGALVLALGTVALPRL